MDQIPLIKVGLDPTDLQEITQKTLLQLTRTKDQQNLHIHSLIPNYSFEKNVKIRYSLDQWKTVLEAPLQWSYSLTDRLDVFNFEIGLDHVESNISLQFCLFYSWESGVIWANNEGKNYSVEMYTVQRMKVIRRTKSRINGLRNDWCGSRSVCLDTIVSTPTVADNPLKRTATKSTPNFKMFSISTLLSSENTASTKTNQTSTIASFFTLSTKYF
jgi:hypothetical protein